MNNQDLIRLGVPPGNVIAAQTDLVDVLGRFDPKLVKMCPAGDRATRRNLADSTALTIDDIEVAAAIKNQAVGAVGSRKGGEDADHAAGGDFIDFLALAIPNVEVAAAVKSQTDGIGAGDERYRTGVERPLKRRENVNDPIGDQVSRLRTVGDHVRGNRMRLQGPGAFPFLHDDKSIRTEFGLEFEDRSGIDRGFVGKAALLGQDGGHVGLKCLENGITLTPLGGDDGDDVDHLPPIPHAGAWQIHEKTPTPKTREGFDQQCPLPQLHIPLSTSDMQTQAPYGRP